MSLFYRLTFNVKVGTRFESKTFLPYPIFYNETVTQTIVCYFLLKQAYQSYSGSGIADE